MFILIVFALVAFFLYLFVQAVIHLALVAVGVLVMCLMFAALLVGDGADPSTALGVGVGVYLLLAASLYMMFEGKSPKPGEPGYTPPKPATPTPPPPPPKTFYLPNDPFWTTPTPAGGHVPAGNTLTPLHVGPPKDDPNAQPHQWWRKAGCEPELWVEAHYIREARAKSLLTNWFDNLNRSR